MAQRRQERKIVMRVGVSPARGKIQLVRICIFAAPVGLIIAGHYWRSQTPGRQPAAVDEAIGSVIADSQMAREWRDYEIGRTRNKHGLQSGGAICFDHCKRLRIHMPDENAVAILLA